ncbi:MAG: hypothetical protein JO320_14985 [Alphaproteobacteria bacterium]|nr:hypothetical protein [Alphaproteobacteria bacterium]
MIFARTAVIAIAVLSLSGGEVTAGGPYRPFQLGLWSGGAYTDDRTGGFSHCSAGVVYDSGINLFVVSTEAHGWWLGFASQSWSLTPSTGIPVKLQFDSRPPLEVAGTIADHQLLLVPMPDESHLIETFWHSTKIEVAIPQHSFSLSLSATAGLGAELANCVRRSVALDIPAPAPPAPAGPGPAQLARTLPAPDAPEFEEIKLAKNFLLATRLPNAQLIETDKPPALASFRAVWRSDDAAGAVKILPGRDATGIAIASDLISIDPKLCKGNFAAARSSDVIDGSVVVRAALSCEEGQNDRTAQYFVTPRRRGGFVVFAVIGNNGSGGFPSDRLKPESLAKAALQAAAPGD